MMRWMVWLAVMLGLVACAGGGTAVPPTASHLPTSSPFLPLPEVTTAVGSATAVPPPSLFATTWEDRELFRAGLVASEQAVLAQLPGAPVYHLDLQIVADTVVNGRQQLLYTNQEDEPLHELYFHLFPNLLDGSLLINQLLVNGTAVAPIYESTNNSQLRLPLPHALLPGEQLVVEIDFVTTVPVQNGRNYGVLAYIDEILALAHFYPQVAVYDEQGWHVTAPSVGGDVTYADVAFYLVRLTAAADLVLVAGGVEVARQETADSQTITLAAGPMRDFYVAASRRYEVTSSTIGEVTVNSYAPTEYSLGATAALNYALQALESFSGRFSPYPYTELDIVTTATSALGIEYPSIIANRLEIYDSGNGLWGDANWLFLESTTAHEVAHQWFYGLVGNNQLSEPWLDEALTQYLTYLYYLDHYGVAEAEAFYQMLDGRWRTMRQPNIPIGLPVAAYSSAEYGAIIYGRGPLFFAELATIMGQDRFDQFLRDYTTSHQWAIATSQSLKETAERHCQCNLTQPFADWVYE